MVISKEEFQAEQEHLASTYRTLEDIVHTTRARMEARSGEAAADHESMLADLVHDYDNGTNLETFAEIEAMQRIIDSYNYANRADGERLARAEMLLNRPYFAKISLRFKPGEDPRDIYLGVTGIANDGHKQIVIDWRSPIAEVYYNQSMGPTSYRTDDGRIIHADLEVRRQFDITRDTLNACFDTSVAIEDPLLLASLARERSDKLADITATIQKEQNAVVRHEDVPVLLVNGIAGSGKTSVLLQRIAYLFFRERETLDPRDVVLITPNPVFRTYIDNVLPSMGERNPQILTWLDLLGQLGLQGRATSDAEVAQALRRVDEELEGFLLEDRDFQAIEVNGERVVSAAQVRNIYRKFVNIPQGPHRSMLVIEELKEKVHNRIISLCKTEKIQDELYDLSIEDEMRIFGQPLVIQDEKELPRLAKLMLEDRWASVIDAIEDGAWLRIDRIGMRMLGRQTLSAEEWIYVKLAFAGGANRAARYVMIDEVQDYTEAQLMMLARYFCNAHFLLLGDPNQAIHSGTATFDEVKRIFQDSRGSVDEYRLMTSYRSTPEVTALFTSLMSESEAVRTSSVQREGDAPIIEESLDGDVYRKALRDAVLQACQRAGLSSSAGAKEDDYEDNENEGKRTSYLAAVIVAGGRSLRDVRPLLSDCPIVELDGKTPLPQSGVVLTDVASAKGLEFDEVIIPDASDSVYREDGISRCKLYTAVSRATQHVIIFSNGPLSPLLSARSDKVD